MKITVKQSKLGRNPPLFAKGIIGSDQVADIFAPDAGFKALRRDGVRSPLTEARQLAFLVMCVNGMSGQLTG